MGGVRIGGTGLVVVCSPPWTAFGGSGTAGDPQVYSACSNSAPGTARQFTDFSGFADSDQNFNPVISPDGTKILFEVLSPSSGFREIWVVDAIAGSTPTQLVANGSQYCFHPFWGDDSDTFVYVLGSGGAIGSGSIYKDTVSAPGSPTLLKANSGSQGCFRPQFNFDGTRVAYLYTATGDPQLRCMDDDGSNDGLVDDTLSTYDSNEPPQFSWATTQNLLAFSDAGTPQDIYVIDDTGAGKQLVASGAVISGRAWATADEFVVVTITSGGNYEVYRAEIDGSGTTQLGTFAAAASPSYFRGALVYQNRIWMISATDATASKGEVSYMSMTGGTEVVVFDSSAGSGDQVFAFTGGDGWYFN